MHKGDQVMLTRSSWWQQQLIPRRLREDLVVMALLHRLLEIRQRQGGGTESAKDKRNERSSLVIRRAKPLRGICVLHSCAWLSWQSKGLCQDRRMEPCRWEGYLFIVFCRARQLHGPIISILPLCLTLSPHQWINWWRICLLTPRWCLQGPALWLSFYS